MPIEADERTKLISPSSGASTSSSVFLNLTMTAVGAGCMAMPYTLVASGYILGVILLLLCAVLSGTSLIALAHLTRRTGKSDYSEIVQDLLGDSGRLLSVLGVCLVLIGANAVFLDISTDLVHPFTESYGPTLATRIAVAGLMALISLPRTMHALRYISFVGMACLCYILLGVLYHLGKNNGELGYHSAASVRAFKPGLGVILALNLQSTAFMCHPSVPILYTELRSDSKHKMVYIIQLSVAFAFVFYLLMAVGHFYVQKGQPSGNLLADYPPSDAMMSLAKCVLSLVLIMKSPLIYRPMNSLFYATFQLPPPSQFIGVLECFAFYAFLVFLTVNVPDLVTLMSWMGLTCGVLIGFILPGAMLIVDAGRVEPLDDGSFSWLRGARGRMIGAIIAACGAAIMIFGPFTLGFNAT